MRVHSKDDRGSLFSIMVPMRDRQVDECGTPKVADITTGLEDLSIFYVDDDENNIHALGTLMENWGCRYSSATSFDKAIGYASEHDAPDAILMDYQLGPDCNGIQLARELRKQWQEVPVCIVSAAPDHDLSMMISRHSYDFLRKPIKPGKLRALLERYIQKKNR